MRVFITGASGFIGLAATKELLAAGHEVLGLARSDASAKLLKDAGAEVSRGSLEDLESLKTAASKADAIIHSAFDHSAFNHGPEAFVQSCELDRAAIEALGEALNGTKRLLLVSAGVGITPGKVRTEEDPVSNAMRMPRVSEETANAIQARGGNVATVRLPQVHDRVKQGLITYLVKIAQQTGVSAYVGEGSNRWAAAHIDDVARLYKLAVEKGEGNVRYHAVGEEGVSVKSIADTLGKTMKLPVVQKTKEEAAAHFGFLASFIELDMPAANSLTKERLGWNPTGVGLLTDLQNLQIPESVVK